MKIRALLIALTLVFTTVTISVYAEEVKAESQYLKTPESKIRRKFARGIGNIFGAVYEIPTGIKNVSQSDGLKIGWTSGLTQGIVMMLGRILTGTYEVLTFPLPYPDDYEPIIQPEFPWQVQGPYGQG